MRHSIVILLLAFSMIRCGDDGNTPDSPGDGPLSVTAFAPLTAAHDSIVTITGTGFSDTPSGNTVTLNGIAVTVISAQEKELKIKVPKNKDCSGVLKVNVSGESATAPQEFTYQLTYVVTTLAGNSEGLRESVDGMGTDARFFGPSGITLDETGVLYIAEGLGHRIRRIGTDGMVTTLAGTGEHGNDDGPLAEATFATPTGITVSTNSVIYLTDRGRGSFVKKIQGGSVVTIAGGESGFSDGVGAEALFAGAAGIAITRLGKIYVTDVGNHRIRVITNGNLVGTLAGSDEKGTADGQGDDAQFEAPSAICVDNAGNAYVTDNTQEYHAIRKVTEAGVVTTIAGGFGHGNVDGTGADASFVSLNGIAIDSDGNLYVTDRHWIRKVTPAGVVTTIAGNGTNSSLDGVGTKATFNSAKGIAVSPSGILYVAEGDGDVIRRLIPE